MPFNVYIGGVYIGSYSTIEPALIRIGASSGVIEEVDPNSKIRVRYIVRSGRVQSKIVKPLEHADYSGIDPEYDETGEPLQPEEVDYSDSGSNDTPSSETEIGSDPIEGPGYGVNDYGIKHEPDGISVQGKAGTSQGGQQGTAYGGDSGEINPEHGLTDQQVVELVQQGYSIDDFYGDDYGYYHYQPESEQDQGESSHYSDDKSGEEIMDDTYGMSDDELIEYFFGD